MPVSGRNAPATRICQDHRFCVVDSRIGFATRGPERVTRMRTAEQLTRPRRARTIAARNHNNPGTVCGCQPYSHSGNST